MRTITRFTAAALVLASIASPVSAQRSQVARADTMPRPTGAIVREATTCCLSKLTAAEEARIARRLADADALTTQGRMTEARSILREVIEVQEEGGAYPAIAMRRLANVEFSLNRPIVAAGVLVDLADAAAAVGDPNTELHALMDAIVLYGQAGRRTQARDL